MTTPFAMLWWAAGCSAPVLPDPVVEGVEPAFAYNGDDETVTIFGQAFYPQVAIDTRQGGTDVDKSFSAWLVGAAGSHPFVGVGITDDRHLSATLESGVPPGSYDLEIEGPTGGRGRLEGAFTVTDAEAAQIVLESPDGVVFDVTEDAVLRIDLEDLGGDRVAIPFEIAVIATGAGPVEFVSNTLRDGQPTPDADGVRGFVDDGTATVTIHASAPGPVTVEVAPWDAKSTVIGDTLALAFQPGDDLRVALRLPVDSPLPAFTAGIPFVIEAELVDQFDNPVGGRLPGVTLRTTCSEWGETVDLEGPTAIEVLPRRVSSEICPEDTIVSDEPAGSSLPFTVVPGLVHHFAVYATSVQAGDVQAIIVQPEDVFFNRTTWSGVLTLVDPWGDPIPNECSGAPNAQFCPAYPTRAGIGLRVTATGDDGTTGISNAFVITAGDVPSTAAVEVAGPLEAGIPHPVIARTFDTWGNAMDTSVLGPDPFVITDPLGEVACTSTGTLIDGGAGFDCTLFTAAAATTLTVDVPAHGLAATSAPFDVVNGTLAVVRFSGEATVVAGSLLTLDLTAEDAYGNPYLSQNDPLIDIVDDSGTFSALSATFEADGTAEVSGFFTRAGLTTVRGLQGGVDLGGSDPIPVVAAATGALRLTLLAPWAWEDEPSDLVVEAVDTFGNRTGWSGSATVVSETTGSPAITLPLVNGVGTDTFTWTASAFVDQLTATSGPYAGESEVAVVRRCPVGPNVAVSFAGASEAIACADPITGDGVVTADLSGSSAGLAVVEGYAIAEIGGVTMTDTQPLLELGMVGLGRHALRGLAVDALGCGSEVDVAGWLGPDDGTPVGPIALSTVAVQVYPVDTATIDVDDVVDCSRDPAAFQEIEVRATGGELSATPTGSGLVLALDANGAGVLTLDTSGGLSYGDLEVHAGVPSGAAGGTLVLPVADDNVRPTVIAQDPVGFSSATVSEVHLWFSETLLSSSVVAGNFSVTGPAATTVTDAELQPGDTEVVLTLSPAVHAGDGVWTVTAVSSIRDEAGNRLAGDWGALPASYAGAFGDAGSPPAEVVCTSFDPSELVIRPDGDPGFGVEADRLSIGLSASQAPAWWVVEVRDTEDVVVRQDWFVPAGAIDAVVWDGRDTRGLVVPNGVWQVSVWPDDGIGNRGPGCELTVTVDNFVLGVVP